MAFRITVNHEAVRSWIEEHNGHPVVVRGTDGDIAEGTLSLVFDDASRYEEIAWEEFFDRFDADNLAFCYKDGVQRGQEAEAYKLIDRDLNLEDHTELPDNDALAEENLFSSSPLAAEGPTEERGENL